MATFGFNWFHENIFTIWTFYQYVAENIYVMVTNLMIIGFLPHLICSGHLFWASDLFLSESCCSELFKRLTQLERSDCVCLPAVAAVEVIRMVGVILEQQRPLLYNGVTLLTDVLAKSPSLLSVVTGPAQVPDGTERKKWDSTLD